MNTTTIGTHAETKPEGMLRGISFPRLTLMDTPTSDGRQLDSEGGGTRELPRPIWFQKVAAMGHLGAVAVGHLDQVTFDEDENGQKFVSGRGWLIDAPEGREAALFVSTKTIFHTSADLNDVRVRFELVERDDDDLDLLARFREWNIGGTTLVGSPAFADMHGTLDDETKASLMADDSELVVEGDVIISFDCDQPEMVAAGGSRVPWSDFHIPEPNHRQKIIVEEDGRVYGHLAIWDEPHEGFPDRRRYPPRPGDGYASFNQPGPLTEHGQVETGPIFLLGGHPERPLGNSDPYKAYGGVENCWADVRVTAGVFGPWISGRVRPGVDDTMLYAARASRISGHWVGDRLRAITSCNVEGFPVGGSGIVGEVAIRDGEVLELVASYGGEHDGDSDNPIRWSDVERLAEMLAPMLSTSVEGTIEDTIELDGLETWTAEELADAVVERLRALTFAANAAMTWTTAGASLIGTADDLIHMSAAPTHHTGNTSVAWDAGANEKRLPSPIPVSTANKVYAWIDSSAVSEGKVPKTGAKLPHHMVGSDGSPGVVNTRALAAAMAALHGGRGGGVAMPASDKRAVYNHLAAHYRDADMEPPDFAELESASAEELLEMELGLID